MLVQSESGQANLVIRQIDRIGLTGSKVDSNIPG